MKLRFDSNVLDCVSRRLWHAGHEVHLSTKAFDLLVLLAERRPAAVRKSEIKSALWPDTFVSETNLPTLIAEVREALGDDARQGHYVRTVHGFGYAFAANVVVVESSNADGGAAAWLVGPTTRVTLARGENVLGREGDNVIELHSPTVSRRHARIVIAAEQSLLEDLGSKNGTYLNESRVTAPIALADGDVVRVGSLVFTIRFARTGASTQTM